MGSFVKPSYNTILGPMCKCDLASLSLNRHCPREPLRSTGRHGRWAGTQRGATT